MDAMINTLQVVGYACLVAEAILVIFLLIMAVEYVRESHRRKKNSQELKSTAKHRAPETALEAAKRELREEKERIARRDSFFAYLETGRYYVPGFDETGALIHRGQKVPTEKAMEYYDKMDEMDDTQVMKVYTEEI